MSDKAWKAFERRIAKSLGTQRTPLSGSADRPTHADAILDELYVECKYRKRLAVQTWYDEALDRALEEGKLPVLALHEKHRMQNLAVIDWDWFVEMYELWRDKELT